MSASVVLAAVLSLPPFPALEAPTRDELALLRADVRRMHGDLDGVAQAPDVNVARNLARMEAHLHLVRAQLCETCIHDELAPSVYDDVEAVCEDRGVVTSALEPQAYAALMRTNAQWMRTRLARIAHERSPYARQRLGYQYYNRIRYFIERAAPQCRPRANALIRPGADAAGGSRS